MPNINSCAYINPLLKGSPHSLACSIENPLLTECQKPEVAPSTSGKVKSFKGYLKAKGEEWIVIDR